MRNLLRTMWFYRVAYLFMLPALLVVLGIRFLPTLDAVRLSFYNLYLGRPTSFAGLGNYQQLLTDTRFINNLRVTAVFVTSVVILSFLIGFLFAFLLQRVVRRFSFFRTILFIPYVIMLVVVAMMWRWLADPVRGLLNFLLITVGMDPVPFLTRPATSLPMMIAVAVWNMYPFPMILLLAGLTSIPEELYQAARVDGVGGRMQFMDITIPLLKPTMFITVTTLTLFALYALELPLALTGGGPAYSTEVLGVRLYIEAFQYFNRGLASALGIVILLINMVLVVLYSRIFRSRSYY